jgi:NADP-reducing hydrogenase subunit HndB
MAMAKMKIEDLARIRDAAKYKIALRQGAGRVRINVHMGTCGIAAGAREILTTVMKEIETRNLHDVIVTNSGCAGLCSQEPMMTIEVLGQPAPVKYVFMTPEKVRTIIDDHVVNGQVVTEYALALGSETTR